MKLWIESWLEAALELWAAWMGCLLYMLWTACFLTYVFWLLS